MSERITLFVHKHSEAELVQLGPLEQTFSPSRHPTGRGMRPVQHKRWSGFEWSLETWYSLIQESHPLSYPNYCTVLFAWGHGELYDRTVYRVDILDRTASSNELE